MWECERLCGVLACGLSYMLLPLGLESGGGT